MEASTASPTTHAAVVAREGVTVDVDGLDAHARADLAPYKVPKSYEVVDALPRTEVGKLRRGELLASRTETSSSSR